MTVSAAWMRRFRSVIKMLPDAGLWLSCLPVELLRMSCDGFSRSGPGRAAMER
jgi:hypothetical protein